MAGVGRDQQALARRQEWTGQSELSPLDAACSFGSIFVLSLLHKIVESQKMRVFILVTRKILCFTQQSCIYRRPSRRLVSQIMNFVAAACASYPSFCLKTVNWRQFIPDRQTRQQEVK